MNNSIFLGNRIGYAASRSPYFFPTDLLTRHCYVIGKTGTGKTTLLQTAVSSLIRQGRGVGIINPHGDFAETTLNLIPPDRIDDVVYLDFTDEEHAPALNLLSSTTDPANRPLIASALVAAFRHIWSESWGPRMEYILYNALRVLLDSENSSLVSLPLMLSDSNFRRRIVRQCRDPFVKRFWTDEFDAWDKRFRLEAIAPIQNKLGQFTTIPALRHCFGQVRLRVDFRDLLDSGKILVVNLSKGKLGEDASRLVGALLTAFLSSIAMSRADMPAEQRKDFILFIDEAQNFLSDALTSILSESRKYGLGLVLSHQFLDQLSPKLQNAVLGNAGSIISFAVSGDDSERLALNFGDSFKAHQFADLPHFTTFVRTGDEPWYPYGSHGSKCCTACSYLAERGLDPETVEHFGLGYCSRGVLRGRIAIPIHNRMGEIVAYAGRWPGDLPENIPKYMFPKGFGKNLEVFNLHRALREPDELPLVIVEGFFDCFALWQAGIAKCVALMGCSISDEQERLLSEALPNGGTIELLLDNDEAGRHGTEEIARRLLGFALVRSISLPQGVRQLDELPEDKIAQIFE